MTPRQAELAAAADRLRERLAAACRAVGRDPAEVELLPVTKYYPVSDIEVLYGLGFRAFGESRDQSATAKIAELSLPDVRWHMIGRLQRNKARSVAGWADTVHSVDSVRLITALSGAASGDARERPLRVLLQVSLDGDPSRGGVPPDGLAELADRAAVAPGLELAGVMAVPPLGTDPDAGFAELARLHERLLRAHPNAVERSAGMSGDLEAAVRHGSTCVRVGTALLGTGRLTSL